MTTDHATRRDTAVADVLAAIDAVTAPRCRTCDTELSPDAPSEDWCSESCAVAWQQTTSPPLHMPDDAEESDAIRLLREARLRRRNSDDPYRIDRRHPGADAAWELLDTALASAILASAGDRPPLTADQLADASIEASTRAAYPLERWAAGHRRQMIETTTAYDPDGQRVTGDGTGTPLPPAVARDVFWEWSPPEYRAPLADAVEDTLHVQLPAWQRHTLAVMSRIRRIQLGRTR